jgi:hydroxypyruvate reductase
MKQESSSSQHRRQLIEIFQAALVRVKGEAVVAAWLQTHSFEGKLRLVAIGKAAQSMADGAEQVLGGQIAQALIITKQGHLDQLRCRQRGWQTIEAAHPVPDANSLRAGEQLLAFLAETDERPLLFLISGGASSLVEAPVSGVDLEFIARSNRWLLGSGLDIVQMNLIRKGLSRIKGGGLLAHLKGRKVHALAISDVPGDRPQAIGSGLLVPEPGLARQLAAMNLPHWLRERLQVGLAQRTAPPSSVPPMQIVANLGLAREAAAERARELGYEVRVDNTLLEGEAAEMGYRLARAVKEGPSGISIWGGETTVELPQEPGQGGRNQHLALAAATRLAGSQNCCMLAAGTDGTDGPTGDAGALVDGQTLERGNLEGLDAVECLVAADAGHFLEASGDLITTGPTGTNVMDLVIGLKLS